MTPFVTCACGLTAPDAWQGAPLTTADLVVDEELKRRIQEHHIRSTLASQAADDDGDMYSFD